MFLQKVTVSHFVRGVTGSSEFWGNCARKQGRRVVRDINKKPDEVLTVIGQTQLYEGLTHSNGSDEPSNFEPKVRHKVYIVAKGLGRRFKVLPEDIQLVE
jgi:hypothetical protein